LRPADDKDCIMTIRLCVFDAYGTLFDVAAAARDAAGEPGAEAWAERWPALAEHWRRKQLEYTWIRALVGAHADFWQVTQDALDWALEAEGLEDPRLRQRLLDLYHELAPFAEVPGTLSELKAQGAALAILSNGSPQMLDAAARSAEIDPLLDAILSVESVGIFKPHASVYALVEAGSGFRRARPSSSRPMAGMPVQRRRTGFAPSGSTAAVFPSTACTPGPSAS
jgi:2-haloacid dehalogenase